MAKKPAAMSLVLHGNNGSPVKDTTMPETLYALGITPFSSRFGVSNVYPYSESLFKALNTPNDQSKWLPGG